MAKTVSAVLGPCNSDTSFDAVTYLALRMPDDAPRLSSGGNDGDVVVLKYVTALTRVMWTGHMVAKSGDPRDVNANTVFLAKLGPAGPIPPGGAAPTSPFTGDGHGRWRREHP